MLQNTVKRKITEINANIRTLEAQLKELDNEARLLYNANLIKAEYCLKEVFVDENDSVRLIGELVNEPAKKEFMALFGHISGSWDKQLRSVGYYRVGGVLLHGGGGWIILKDQQVCTDEEWDRIKSGDVPKKFRSTNIDYWNKGE